MLSKAKWLVFIVYFGLFLGGCQMFHPSKKESAVTNKSEVKQDKMTTKDKQLAYLKEHEQEIIDFVKSQNDKIESVQIDWNDVRWGEGGLIKTDYYISIYGKINHIADSGWGVDIPLNDDKTINIKEMNMGDFIRIGGNPIE